MPQSQHRSFHCLKSTFCGAQAYHRYRADRIVGEVNNGGDLIESTLRAVDANIPFRAVHASRGKLVRAEPVSAMYERGIVHHVGSFAKLEYENNQQAALMAASRLAASSMLARQLRIELPGTTRFRAGQTVTLSKEWGIFASTWTIFQGTHRVRAKSGGHETTLLLRQASEGSELVPGGADVP